MAGLATRPVILFLGANLEKLVRLGPAGIRAFLWLSAPGIAGLLLLYELGAVSEWLHARGDAGLLLYAAVFMVTSGIGLLPTTAQAVLGGWVFGPAKALLAATVAYGGAALLGLLITRAVAGKRVERIFDKREQARAIRDALIGRGFLQTTMMVALLRLPPQVSTFCLYKFRHGQLRRSSCAISAREHSGHDSAHACRDDFCRRRGENGCGRYPGVC